MAPMMRAVKPVGRRLAALFITAAAALSVGGAAPAGAAKVLVFAAASTAAPMDEITALYAARGGGQASTSFASSSTLAKQILNGAPADIYISANSQWMDLLARKKAVDPASRIDLLSNRLVMIAPAGPALAIDIGPGFDLKGALRGGMLAMGDPDHVPAGIYARAALEDLGVWPALAGKVARTQDVRAALALVERGEAAAGVVYATDAAFTAKVRIIATFPAASHPRITYPAAIVAGRERPEVRLFYEFLKSKEAADVFARHGFTPIPGVN